MNPTDAEVKSYIADILTKNKALTERGVHLMVRRRFKLGRKRFGRVIREVRRGLGIDRPRALIYARSVLARNPTLEAKKLIKDLAERFGISIGAPDVSRLRPKRSNRGATSVVPGVEPRPAAVSQRPSEAISIRYDASGAPENVARFFRSLAE